jgi:hypothetical protein
MSFRAETRYRHGDGAGGNVKGERIPGEAEQVRDDTREMINSAAGQCKSYFFMEPLIHVPQQ